MSSSPPIQRVVYSAEVIAGAVSRLAQLISADYQGRSLHLVGVLGGALPFLADLARSLKLDQVTMDFLCVKRRSGSTPQLIFDLDSSIAGRDVVLVEDFVSEGRTLTYLRELLLLRQPASLRVCSLVKRNLPELGRIEPDYVGLDCDEPGYLFGYGLDIEERWRQLPYIALAQPTSK